jgi:hypothetical protein
VDEAFDSDSEAHDSKMLAECLSGKVVEIDGIVCLLRDPYPAPTYTHPSAWEEEALTRRRRRRQEV